MTLSNDSPITRPEEDLFGLTSFANAVAQSIEKASAPEGLVLALNGPWGSGKSSAINLVRSYLKPAEDRGEIVVIPFNPWWFRGTDALTLAFFRELGQAIGPSLSDRAKKSFAAIGRGVSAVGPLLEAIPTVGGPLGAIAKVFGHATSADISVEKERSTIVSALKKQQKRFVIVIDDIDRLSPDDAITIFRLVKSVGRLPNVIYLLAFDRDLSERTVEKEFPAEGANYLDKIIQSSFELPPAAVDVLRSRLLEAARAIMGTPSEDRMVRFMNLFYDVVAPMIRTPRDIVRLSNNLSATWPAIANELDRADFLALTALRLAEPALYAAVRDNAELLCGPADNVVRDRQQLPAQYDEMLRIGSLPAREQDRWRRALRRLFPRLDYVWGNTIVRDNIEWDRERRLCSKKHFRTYFSYEISGDVISAEESAALVERADDAAFIKERFRDGLSRLRADGTSGAALLLDELNIRAADIHEGKVASLTSTLFEIADELDIESDRGRAFSIANNNLRLHWLMNRLVIDRFDEAGREAIFGPAMEAASVAWAADFARRCREAFEPAADGREIPPVVVGQPVAERFQALALAKLRDAAATGSLINHPALIVLLFEWGRLSPEGDVETRRWTDDQLANPLFVKAMVREMPSEVWSQGLGWDGMGDVVSRRSYRIDIQQFNRILDVPAFEARVDELEQGEMTERERAEFARYRAANRGDNQRPGR